MEPPDRNQPIPALFIRVESGTTEPGPPLRVRVGGVDRAEALGTPDIGRDVIVITLEDCEAEAAARILDVLFPAMPALAEHLVTPRSAAEKAYAFKIGDARALCIAPLHHLAAGGEPMARALVGRLDEVVAEIRRNRMLGHGGDNRPPD